MSKHRIRWLMLLKRADVMALKIKIFRTRIILLMTVACYFILLNNLLAFAKVLISTEDALKELMPQAQTIEKKTVVLSPEEKERVETQAHISLSVEYDREFRIYIGKLDEKILGYVLEDVVRGKWGPIHYLLALDAGGKITNVVVLDYFERRGKPVAHKSFLSQFFGKTVKHDVKFRKDINGISGATISSRAMTDGIRKLLYVFEEFIKS